MKLFCFNCAEAPSASHYSPAMPLQQLLEIKRVAASDREAHQIIDQPAAVERLRKDRSCGHLLCVLAAVSGQENEGVWAARQSQMGSI